MGGYNRSYPSLGWVGVDCEQIVRKEHSSAKPTSYLTCMYQGLNAYSDSLARAN